MSTTKDATAAGIDLADLFGEASDTFRRACANARFRRERSYSIAGQHIRLVFCSERLADLFTPALEHLAVETTGQADLTVRLWDSVSTGTEMPPPPWSTPNHIRLSQVFTECDGRFYSSFRLWTNALTLLDSVRGEALFWTRDAGAFNPYESGIPLRDLFHWWMTAHGFTFLHAAAVGSANAGALIVGPSGSGKSTSSLACLAAGLDYVGDDYCILDNERRPRVHSLYSSARIDGRGVEQLAAVRSTLINHDRLEQEKGLLLLNHRFRKQMLRQMPVSAITVPEIQVGAATRAEPISPTHALRALAPSSLFQLAGAAGFERRDRGAGFRRIAMLVKEVPSFRLVLGGNPREVPPVVRSILDGSASKGPPGN
jgi:hypothetical protein